MFILCFGYSDFSLYSVYANSHTNKQYIYKIGAAWSTHEGSMLLWLVVMSIYAVCNSYFCFTQKITNKIYHNICHLQAFFQILFYFLVILIANPFKFTEFNALEGMGFNPLLEDYALLIHPPILYFGYAGGSILFAQVLVLIFCLHKNNKIKNNVEQEKECINLNSQKEFAYNSIKIWLLIPLFFLTIGIFLGAWWSYRELGWGGFWAWDPVENVSLLPWLSGIAALHLLLIKNRSRLIECLLQLNLLLVFVFSVFATFVVRSGLISSLHSFAKNNERAIYFVSLLVFLFIVMIFGLVKSFISNKSINIDNNIDLDHKNKTNFSLKKLPIQRVFLYLKTISSIGFCLLYLIISFSILWPIYMYLYYGQSINISEKFFQISFGLVVVFNLFFLNFSFIYYFRKSLDKVFYLIFLCQNIFICILTGLLYSAFDVYFLSSVVISMASLVMINVVYLCINNFRKFNTSSLISHFGFALLICSSVVCGCFQSETESYLSPQDNRINLNNYSAVLKNLDNTENANYVAIIGNFEIFYKNNLIGLVRPELKFYKIEQMQLADSDSISHYFSDIYVVILRLSEQKDKILVKIYYKPMVRLIWLSGLILGLGLMWSLFNRFSSIKYKKIKNSI